MRRIRLKGRSLARLHKMERGEDVEIRLEQSVKGIKSIRGKLMVARKTGNKGIVGAINTGEDIVFVKKHYIGCGVPEEVARNISVGVFAGADIAEGELEVDKKGRIYRTAAQLPIPSSAEGEISARAILLRSIINAAFARNYPKALGYKNITVSDIRVENGSILAPHDATVEREGIPLNEGLEIESLARALRKKGFDEKNLVGEIYKLLETVETEAKLDEIEKEELYSAKAVLREITEGKTKAKYGDIWYGYSIAVEHLPKTKSFWKMVAGQKREELAAVLKAEEIAKRKDILRSAVNIRRYINTLEREMIRDWRTKLRMLAEINRNLASLRIIALRERLEKK